MIALTAVTMLTAEGIGSLRTPSNVAKVRGNRRTDRVYAADCACSSNCATTSAKAAMKPATTWFPRTAGL
jgi:hypothetical protein